MKSTGGTYGEQLFLVQCVGLLYEFGCVTVLRKTGSFQEVFVEQVRVRTDSEYRFRSIEKCLLPLFSADS